MSSLFSLENEVGKGCFCLLGEGSDTEDPFLKIFHQLETFQTASLLEEPLHHLVDVNSPLARDARLSREIQGELLHHFRLDDADEEEEEADDAVEEICGERRGGNGSRRR